MNQKIALVTGGSRGLGRDMALSLAGKGIDVILTYHTSAGAAQKVVEEIEAEGRKAVALQADHSDIAAIDSFLDKVQSTLREVWNQERFDFLINNAGIGATIPIAEVTEEAFDKLVNTNFKGVYFLTQKALPLMNDNGGVVFISSGTTRFCVHGYSIYSSLKAALEVFTKYVAKEFGSRGIRSNIVAPGPTETDFNGAAIRNNPQVKSFLSSLSPLGRVGNADDIGSVVAFLCTDEARWINGQRIEVSGGISL
ncbi:MAG: SDR family oxidoreductase [Ignavibacteriae bacterium]|nr:SDR family oxidoreductase [Ignavibacteriota bacterium]MCB9215588.1 SDR family oxidoreductase [Ignavibacteria bacterium]